MGQTCYGPLSPPPSPPDSPRRTRLVTNVFDLQELVALLAEVNRTPTPADERTPSAKARAAQRIQGFVRGTLARQNLRDVREAYAAAQALVGPLDRRWYPLIFGSLATWASESSSVVSRLSLPPTGVAESLIDISEALLSRELGKARRLALSLGWLVDGIGQPHYPEALRLTWGRVVKRENSSEN